MKGIHFDIIYYTEGFFGYGESGDFEMFSFAHLAPILFMLAVIIVVYRNRDRLRNWKHEEDLRYAYVCIMMLFEMGYFWRLNYVGPQDVQQHTMMDRLPLQVCEWTLLICCLMMAKKSEKLFSMVFFLTMSCGIFPLCTPYVISTTGPTYFRYYQYWAEHILPIIGVYYMMFVHGFRPKLKGMLHALIMLLIMLPIALYLNAHYENGHYLYIEDGGLFASIPLIANSNIPTEVFAFIAVASMFGLTWLIYNIVIRADKKKHAKEYA